MDSGLTITAFSTRRGKLKLGKSEMANAGEEDIISSKLPESLISHILSFLPTKDAVRTCLLSKIWKDRWASVTKVDLYDIFIPGCRLGFSGSRHSFVNFINKALPLYDGTMERFSLVIRGKYDVSLLDTWISNILNRRLKNLDIFSYYKLPFSALASHYLFNSTLLEALALETISFSTIQVPTCSVHFGHLKLLKLCGISFNFDSDTSADYLTLSLTLPVLKKFETRNCSWFCAKGVVIEAPLLESISIEQDSRTVSEVRLSDPILFSALHPKEFIYSGYGMSHAILLSDFNIWTRTWKPCCDSATITLNRCDHKASQTILLAFILLKQLRQAKCIKLEGSEVLTQPKVAQKEVPALPVFAILSHLELGLVAIEVLLGLLQKTPVLKTLVLKGISKFAEELLDFAVVPDCLASTLQVVKFEKVNGDEHELFLAKFFMENGMTLGRMGFSLASQRLGKSKVMEEFKEKVYSFKKDFSFATVEFSYD